MSVSNFTTIRQLNIFTVFIKQTALALLLSFPFVASKQKMAHGM